MDNETATQQMVNQPGRQLLDSIVSGSIATGQVQQGGIWNTASIADLYNRKSDVNICIRMAENGRIVTLGVKDYIVSQGTPLLEIIGQALVEAQLEK